MGGGNSERGSTLIFTVRDAHFPQTLSSAVVLNLTLPFARPWNIHTYKRRKAQRKLEKGENADINGVENKTRIHSTDIFLRAVLNLTFFFFARSKKHTHIENGLETNEKEEKTCIGDSTDINDTRDGRRSMGGKETQDGPKQENRSRGGRMVAAKSEQNKYWASVSSWPGHGIEGSVEQDTRVFKQRIVFYIIQVLPIAPGASLVGLFWRPRPSSGVGEFYLQCCRDARVVLSYYT